MVAAYSFDSVEEDGRGRHEGNAVPVPETRASGTAPTALRTLRPAEIPAFPCASMVAKWWGEAY
ncbi:hypothetical protein TGAMA5MH_03020 [Trichoderma gamsii]|uniref:Uncharacterized protein n=1 Tax=Trichoderma gamsii TaxID=398673 RepID=A0A2K0TID5_9HYPO|nr:hypothetical protein TGAMA5MH_03020 [Trichoderma gamsii]